MKLMVMRLTVCVFAMAFAMPVLARDFEYTYEGKTLLYTVLDENAKTCGTKEGNLTMPGNNVSGDLIIPSVVINGETEYSVTSIGYQSFYKCSDLTSIDIPSSVTSIKEQAFFGCSGLSSVELPNSVTSIGDGAFDSCKGLLSVFIPNSVISIGDAAFSGCIGLTSIDIPNSVTSIGKGAFYACIGLTSVIIPNSVTSIGYGPFMHCVGLEKAAYPSTIEDNPFPIFASIKYPPEGTFIENGYIWGSDKSALYFVPLEAEGDFDIPNSVNLIGDWAFSSCCGLTSVNIHSSVTSIGENAFGGCLGLKSIVVDSDNNNFADINGVLYNKNLTKLVQFPGGLTSVTIPNSVTSIGDYAFYESSGLTSVIIPNSVTSIGENAFSFCTGLIKSAYPSTLGNYHFVNGAYIKYPAEDAIIENGVIWNSDKSAIYFIPLDAEGDFSIPSTVTSIERAAFLGCSGLTSIDIPNSVTSIGVQAFWYCNGLSSVIIPNSVTSIGGTVFYGCKGLKKTAYPSTLDNPFPSGTCIKYPAEGAIIENGCIWGPDKSSIYFVPWDAKGEFCIPSSVILIENSAFQDCSGLTSVDIPNSVCSIGRSAFMGCTSLKSVKIPDSVIYIEGSAFSLCRGLTALTIGNSVEEIEPFAFYNCVSLSTIYSYNIIPPSTVESAFLNVSSDVIVYVPKGRVSVYSNKEGWRSFWDFREIPESGVETVNNNVVATYDVYNLQGQCLMRNVSSSDVEGLKAGIYIINGKKIFKRK